MSLQVEKLEKNMAKLTIEVSADEFSKALEDAYQKNKSKISVPGFRKGKVPKKMIEQMYGKGVFYEDAANFMSYNSREGGYLGEIYTPDELIQEHIELNAEPFEIIEDIVNSIEDIAWAQPDLYYDNIKDDLEFQWKYFKEIIKHKSPYL